MRLGAHLIYEDMVQVIALAATLIWQPGSNLHILSTLLPPCRPFVIEKLPLSYKGNDSRHISYFIVWFGLYPLSVSKSLLTSQRSELNGSQYVGPCNQVSWCSLQRCTTSHTIWEQPLSKAINISSGKAAETPLVFSVPVIPQVINQMLDSYIIKNLFNTCHTSCRHTYHLCSPWIYCHTHRKHLYLKRKQFPLCTSELHFSFAVSRSFSAYQMTIFTLKDSGASYKISFLT